MTPEKAILWLMEAASYFRAGAAKAQEDHGHWSGVQNAESCERIVEVIQRIEMDAANEAKRADRSIRREQDLTRQLQEVSTALANIRSER